MDRSNTFSPHQADAPLDGRLQYSFALSRLMCLRDGNTAMAGAVCVERRSNVLFGNINIIQHAVGCSQIATNRACGPIIWATVDRILGTGMKPVLVLYFRMTRSRG